jgi:hypothetical protein
MEFPSQTLIQSIYYQPDDCKNESSPIQNIYHIFLPSLLELKAKIN